MKKENLVVTAENVQVVDGKVVINSEELAAAIQNCEVDLGADEEDALTINVFCSGSGEHKN